MNWKRGLVRLWLLTTVLWLGGAGSIAVLESSPVQVRAHPPDDTACAASRRSAEEFLDSSADGTPATPGACQSRIENVRDWRLPPFEIAIMIIAAPVLLLGFGAATSWMANGFQGAGGTPHKSVSEHMGSQLAESSKPLSQSVPLHRWFKLATLALLCLSTGVAGTVAFYETRNSYENCVLRSIAGAPERALPLIHNACLGIAQ